MGSTAKRLKDTSASRSSARLSPEEQLAEKVSAVIEAQVKKMTPEELRRADAELHKIATRVRATSGTRSRASRKLLMKAFSQPEGSSERRQVFSEYLNALHDEHAK